MTVRKPAPPVTRIGAPATGRPSIPRTIPSMAPVVNCAGRTAGPKATIASRSPSRRTCARPRLLLEHSEAADRIPKGATHKDVRHKMGRQGKPRKPDQRGHAIRSKWNPAVIPIAAGDHGGNREGCYGVTGGEASVSS